MSSSSPFSGKLDSAAADLFVATKERPETVQENKEEAGERGPESPIMTFTAPKHSREQPSPQGVSSGTSKSDEEARRYRREHPAAMHIHVAVHKSLLSVEHQQTDFRGLFNLFCLLLFSINIRLMVENFQRYGVLVGLPSMVVAAADLKSLLALTLLVLAMISSAFGFWVIERYLRPRGNCLSDFIALGNMILLMLVPPTVVLWVGPGLKALGSLCVLMLQCVLVMKSVSFWHTCSDLHKLKACSDNTLRDMVFQRASEAHKVFAKYPQCLSAGLFCQFLVFPTLVFQLWYPRTSHRSWLRVLRYAAEILVLVALQVIIVEQYINPLLNNAVDKGVQLLQTGQYVALTCHFVERLLKLALPNLYIWLMIFVVLFHSWLNLLAELTYFADRQFYLDWWNAVSFRDYWQKWNLPVHHWMARHVYCPLRAKVGFSPATAILASFLLSGAVHEYLVAVPLRISWKFCWITMSAFVIQMPLIVFTDTPLVKLRPHLGNAIFWVTFCFTGQPAAVLFYFCLKAYNTYVKE